MDNKEYNGNLLRKNGLKNTRQRLAILGIMGGQQMPLSAEDVYIELQKLGVAANLSTVYRTLVAMLAKGLVREVGVASDSRILYELNRTEHRHYLVCLRCKKVMPFDMCPVKDFERALAQQTHYTIAGHRLDIYGYCPECQANI